jgi:acetyl esterase/lipase
MSYYKLVVIASLVTILLVDYPGPVQVRADETGGDKSIMIDLWPNGYLGEKGTSRGVLEPSKGDNIARLTEVSIPSLTVYKAPSAKAPTPAVMVCPGGGYSILAMNLEGTEIAEWLNSLGITAIVLKYRVPDNHQGAFEDAQRGMSIIRFRARELNIDPDRIGVIGFSAGGNLSAQLCTNYTERSYKLLDPIDKVSCRPDFAMLVYPYLLGEDGKLQAPLKVDSQTPPTILIHAQDDWVKPESSIYYFLSLKKAKVPAELHVFPTGGHGYGLRPTEHAVSGWPALCNTWMQKMKIITPKK